VGEIGSDTVRVDDIVKCELVDELAGLEEEGQWLTGVSRISSSRLDVLHLSNAAGSTSYDCFDHFVDLGS